MPNTAVAKAFAVLTAISAVTCFGLMYDAIHGKDPTFSLGWASAPTCGQPAPKEPSAFFMHVFFMAMAFGLFAPLGAVTYIIVRDTLGLRQKAAKAVHGLVQLGAFLCSVLGFTQMYYAHGAACGSTVHFQSVHSFVGITVLALFWWQLPSAAAVFSNNTLLASGSAARKTFLRYHVFIGTFTVFAGLATIVTGVLALIAKRPGNGDPAGEPWYQMARGAMAAFVTIVLLALTLFEVRSHPDDEANPANETSALLPVKGTPSP